MWSTNLLVKIFRWGKGKIARAGYLPATLNQELKIVGVVVFGQLNTSGTNGVIFYFGTNGTDLSFWYL